MDVIAAIATGSAATAIGIVRVSGDGCFALCGRVFRAAGGRPFAAQEPRKMVFGEMLDRAGRVIDRVLSKGHVADCHIKKAVWKVYLFKHPAFVL